MRAPKYFSACALLTLTACGSSSEGSGLFAEGSGGEADAAASSSGGRSGGSGGAESGGGRSSSSTGGNGGPGAGGSANGSGGSGGSGGPGGGSTGGAAGGGAGGLGAGSGGASGDGGTGIGTGGGTSGGTTGSGGSGGACQSRTWCADGDGDGYGTASNTQTGCTQPGSGWTENCADCNDSDILVHPGGACRGEGFVLADGVTVSFDYDCDGTETECGDFTKASAGACAVVTIGSCSGAGYLPNPSRTATGGQNAYCGSSAYRNCVSVGLPCVAQLVTKEAVVCH